MSVEGIESFEGWVIAELMGHRKLAGRMSQANVAGAPMMRLDVFVGDADKPIATQFYGSGAFYCITPCDEQIARRFAQRHQPEPVTRWELPQLPAPTATTIREHCDEDLYDGGCCPDCGRDPCDCDEGDDPD